MGRVGQEHLGPSLELAVLQEIGTDHQQGRVFAMGARARLERDLGKPGDLGQNSFESPEDLERALDRRLGLVRVELGGALAAGEDLRHSRVVLHGTGTERVRTRLDPEVHLGESGVMSQHL